jgi:putative spermidine/putrescine transport system permease protein
MAEFQRIDMSPPFATPPRTPRRIARRRRLKPSRIALGVAVIVVLSFLAAPIVILVLTSLTPTATVEFPPRGISLMWYERLVGTWEGLPGTRPGLADAIWFSTWLALLASGICTGAGLLAAVALHKFALYGKEVFKNLFLLPLTFPTLVLGIGLLVTFSELRLFDPFTRLLIGHVIGALPYVLLTVGASLAVYEEEVEEAARSLGANSLQTFWYVTLPLIRSGIMAGAIFAFISSFNNFTVSFFLSVGSAQPLPMWIYQVIKYGHDPLVAAISVFLLAMTVGAVLSLDRLIGLRRVVST